MSMLSNSAVLEQTWLASGQFGIPVGYRHLFNERPPGGRQYGVAGGDPRKRAKTLPPCGMP